jgi:hypothetical protein
MYIRNKKMQRGKTYYIIEDKVKEGSRSKTKSLRYLGSARKILEDLEELDKLRDKLHKKA